MSTRETGKYPRNRPTVDRERAEALLRKVARILVVGKSSDFSSTSLDPLDPKKTYLLAVVEIE